MIIFYACNKFYIRNVALLSRFLFTLFRKKCFLRTLFFRNHVPAKHQNTHIFSFEVSALSSVCTISLYAAPFSSSQVIRRILIYKPPYKPESNIQHSVILLWKPGPREYHLWSVFLSVLQGEIDDRALVGIWQQHRKITNLLFDSVLLTSSMVICPDGKTLT